MRKILTAIFLLNCLVGFSQIKKDSIENLLSKNIEVFMVEAKKGNPGFYDVDLIRPIVKHPELAYIIFKRYENQAKQEANQDVLYELASNYDWLKRMTDNVQFRQEITYNLLQIYKQYKKLSNRDNTFYIPSRLSDPEDSKVSDFNSDAKGLLAELLQDSLISRRMLKVVGVAGMKDQIPELNKFLPEGERHQKPGMGRSYFFSLEWYARMSMARLGDKGQIDYCVQKIENSEEAIMFNSYAAGDYFDYLIYIKQPEVLPFLFDMLIANKEFEDRPLHSTSGFAIYALQRLLVNFPPDEGFLLTKKGEKYYKKWVRQNRGKYEFKD